MKITKILVALAFLFSVSTANAGELSVTGSMEVTYPSEVDRTTGNPLGMDRELKFSGSTELDNGITVSVMQDTSDNLGYGDSKLTFGNIAGIIDIYVGSDGAEMDAIDDITPTAYEEANGSGSGTYQDIGTFVQEMGIGFKTSLPVIGTVRGQYIPKVDTTKNADNAASGNSNATVGSGFEVTTKTALGDLPLVGSFLDGNTITLGYGEGQTSTVTNTSDAFEATAALTGSFGNFSYGFQVEHVDLGQTTAAADADFYKIDTIGLAYAINDALSISYNMMEQKQHNIDADSSFKQKTNAINIGYTVGGMTIGFQDASTDNANMVKDVSDDTRTLGISVAF